MVRLISLLLSACFSVLLLTACSNCSSAGVPSSSAVPAYDGPPSTPAGLIVNPEDPAPGSSSPADSSTEDPSVEKSIAGVIDSAAMGEFLVEVDDGRFLVFSYEGVDTSDLKDTRPGSPIIIYYYGTINGTDTSNITITRMATP